MKIISGDPGTTWTNDTDKLLFQLHVTFFNSCGQCIQYANQIARFWSIPWHRGCNCTVTPVPPGVESRPFIDFREAIAELPIAQQSRVMGASNYRMVESGLVKWDDVVTRARIRALHEVVAEQKLTVKQMTEAGVRRYQAQKAFDLVHSPETVAAATEARARFQTLRDKGLSPTLIKRDIAAQLKSRIGIDGGPGTGPSRFGGTSPVVAPIEPKRPRGPFGGRPGRLSRLTDTAAALYLMDYLKLNRAKLKRIFALDAEDEGDGVDVPATAAELTPVGSRKDEE